MKIMTRRGCLLAPVAAWAAPAAGPALLRVASFGVTPYVFDRGEAPVQGALVDFCDEQLAPRWGVRLQWLPAMTVPRVLRSLQDGTADFCPILTRSPERELQLRFAAHSHLSFESVIALRADHPLAQRPRLQALDLIGLRVGWVQGSPLPPVLETVRIRWDLASVLNWERAILTKLARGQIDAGYFSNPATPAWHIRSGGEPLVLVPLDAPPRPLYAAFAPQIDPALQQRYEPAAREAFAGQAFERHLQRWLRAAQTSPASGVAP